MIKIADFKAICQDMASRINATKCILVRSEPELAQKIKEIDNGELFLVAVIPSSDTRARNLDNIIEIEMIIIYTIIKTSHKDQDDADIIREMGITQDCITAVKNNLLSDAQDCDAPFHQIISRIDFNKMHTDPEYNYLGCDGYSLSFELTTQGF